MTDSEIRVLAHRAVLYHNTAYFIHFVWALQDMNLSVKDRNRIHKEIRRMNPEVYNNLINTK